MRTVLAVIAFALVAGGLLAQPPVAPLPPPAPLPPGEVVSHPLPVVINDPAVLPGGKEVSQPLQPVGKAPADPPASAPTAPEAKSIPPERRHGPLGPGWDDAQLLYWWPERQPIPPLVFGNRSGLPPLPGTNDTRLLAGGRAIDSQPSAGGRFLLGTPINTDETIGLEAAYFFLGTRSFREYVRNSGGIQTFGLPYTNAATGVNEILTLARPGVTDSTLVASTSVRVQGWEVNSVANVMDEKYVKVNALLGWRYFQVHEGLRIEQTQLRYTPDVGMIRTADQFDAHNRFHGGQIGLHSDMRRGIVFCEMTAKVAFGQTYEVVKQEGMTILQTPFTTRAYGGSGIYVQPSSAGRTANGVFAVVPEGTVKFGFRVGDAGRLYVGYSFIYLSDAVRPGDQIDRTLNPSQVPLVSGTGPVYNADRPSRLFNRSDFWTQGLIIGLETRY